MMSLLEERPTGLSRFPIYLLMFVYGLMFASGYSSASLFDDVATSFSEALAVDAAVAKMVLSALVLIAVALPFTIARTHMFAIVIVLFGAMGMLIAIGWMDVWLMVISGILVAALFGRRMAEWLYPTQN